MLRARRLFFALGPWWKTYKVFPLWVVVSSKRSTSSLGASKQTYEQPIGRKSTGRTDKAALFVSKERLEKTETSSTMPPTSARDSYSGVSVLHLREELASVKQELQSTKRELLRAQIRLAQMEHQPLSRLHTAMLDNLTRLDREAHEQATAIRYTAMALQASQDRLEVELRRVLAIGLTPGEIDAAALEAEMRHYIRSNIGFRAESVSKEPPPLNVASKVENKTSNPAMSLEKDSSAIQLSETDKH